MQQKAQQTTDLLKSDFTKEAMNKTIQATQNAQTIAKSRNTLEPSNINAASRKLYDDVVKAPIAKTQNWMKQKEQLLNAPQPNVGPIPLGPSTNTTVREGIEATTDSGMQIVGGKDGTEKTEGRGKTGEGIPLEKVKPEVLKQIHADDNGVYGYLPNEGTAYNRPEYDFTNVEFAKKQQKIRKKYLEATKQLEKDLEKMTAEGYSKEEIGKYVVEVRNQQKIDARKDMLPETLAGIEERNIKKYGNPIGPTAESMFKKLKKSYLKEGINESDEQIWEIIIQKSMKKDDVLNTLLGLEY